MPRRRVGEGGGPTTIGRAFRVAGAAVGAGIASWAAYSALTWAKYGKVDPGRHPKDDLLDRFMSDPEVDEYHSLEVRAPAAITFEEAKRMDLQASLPIKTIFFLRAIPSLLKGQPFRPQGSPGLIEETLGLGFGILAEVPDREIVIGTFTQPWHQNVTFRPLPAEEFATFNEPGYVKIIVSIAAEPLGPDRSRFITRTRVVTTDAEANRKFRLYWSPMSAGIMLIRYFSLPMVKKAAERRAREQLSNQKRRPFDQRI
jgi:hypothetical protein